MMRTDKKVLMDDFIYCENEIEATNRQKIKLPTLIASSLYERMQQLFFDKNHHFYIA